MQILKKTVKTAKGFALSAMATSVTLAAPVATADFQTRVWEALRSVNSLANTEIHQGQSVINGTKVPVDSLPITLTAEKFAEDLRSKLSSYALVAVHHTTYSDVIVITPRGIADREESARASYVISVMNLPDGSRMAMGSPAGAMLRAHLSSPTLQSTWLENSRIKLRAVGNSAFRFGETSSTQEIAQCAGTINQCRGWIVADLREGGFTPVNPDEKSQVESGGISAGRDTPYSGVWRKNSTTIYLNISKQGPEGSAEVGIYEITAK